MEENPINVGVPSQVPEQTTNTVDVWEEKAKQQGWKPQEEWEGDVTEWRPAKEFVERGELFGKISNQSGEIKELRKALNYLVDHHQKVKEVEYKRAVEHLKSQKKEALEEGDADKLIAVDEALLELKEREKANAQINLQKEVPAPTQGFVEFVQNNAWYNTNADMKRFADTIGVKYFNDNPGVAESDLYDYVTKVVKRAYPDVFKKKDTTPSVEGEIGSRPNGSKTNKEPTLTDEERRAMNSFVRAGIMTKEEYLAELGKIKGV